MESKLPSSIELPFYPSKDKDEFSSYWPLFNTSLLSKSIEKAGLLQLSEYLENFHSIPEIQSAYKRHHSVETALCKIYNDLIIKKSTGGCTMLVMLDLSAAFDCIDQETLLQDMELLGIRGTALDWFRSYLTGRHFRVEVENTLSTTAEMNTGICQGTILAPILFSIYTIELYHIISNMGIQCHFYADDTQILIDVESEDQANLDFEIMFEVVTNWMSRRKLKLNAEKTECMILGNRYKLDQLASFNSIELNDSSTLSLVKKVKNLGVLFEQDLSMESQLKSVKGKAIGNLVNIARISKYIDRESKLKLVYGLVFSQVDFCNSLYAGLPNYRLRPLQMIINSSARLIVGLPRFSRERITPICIDLHFLPVKARIMFKICLLVYKTLHYEQPLYLRRLLQHSIPARPLRSGQSERLSEPIVAQSAYSDRCFTFCAPRMYNSLPDEVRHSTSLEMFKRRLKTFIFRQAYDLETIRINEQFDVELKLLYCILVYCFCILYLYIVFVFIFR